MSASDGPNPDSTVSSQAARPPKVAALGGGLIGQSWIALFLAGGAEVTVYDPAPDTGPRIRTAVEQAWPVLVQLGLTDQAAPDLGRLRACTDPCDAVEGADFVQESVPERIALKHDLYTTIEPALGDDAIVASSASGLTLGELQAGWRDPSRLVLGHPFNPPHLIPLVEVMGNERTAPGVVARARAFYESFGKVTIEVRKEVPGHIANRLQAAVWREAVHLVREGVGSVEDVDLAIAAGPGIRWAVFGPTTLFHLGAGDEGLTGFCERYADSFHRWWDDLGDPRLDPSTIESLAAGVAEATAGRSIDDLVATRDRLIATIVAARRRSFA